MNLVWTVLSLFPDEGISFVPHENGMCKAGRHTAASGRGKGTGFAAEGHGMRETADFAHGRA